MFALLGASIGVAATAFIKALVFAEDTFPKIKNPYLRNVIGMLMVGILMYALLRLSGHYFIQGVGYATIQAILQNHLVGFCAPAWSVLRQAVRRPMLPGLRHQRQFPLTIAVLMGATLGAAFGELMALLGPVHGVDPVTCAIIGMAAMVTAVIAYRCRCRPWRPCR